MGKLWTENLASTCASFFPYGETSEVTTIPQVDGGVVVSEGWGGGGSETQHETHHNYNSIIISLGLRSTQCFILGEEAYEISFKLLP